MKMVSRESRPGLMVVLTSIVTMEMERNGGGKGRSGRIKTTDRYLNPAKGLEVGGKEKRNRG